MSNGRVNGDPPLWTKRTPERERVFLEVLSRGASVYTAATAAGMARSTAYTWRDEDPEFAAKWDNAVESGTDLMEDEAFRRAVEGTEKPVYQGGMLVGKVREYSDTLMIFQLKGRRRDKYSEKTEQKVSLTLKDELALLDAARKRAGLKSGE